MLLIDFRNWVFDKSLGYLPNAQKELLQRDFDSLNNTNNFDIIQLKNIAWKEISGVSSLFFKNSSEIAVSPIKNLSKSYECIDAVLEFENKDLIDYTEAAAEEVYFYGSNSLVAHFGSEIALCGLNSNSDESLFEEYCEDFELTPFSFELSEDLFTSDMAFFIENVLFICLDYITDKKVKKQFVSVLKTNNIQIVPITKEQVAKNVLDMMFISDSKCLILIEEASELLTKQQKEILSSFSLIVLKLPFLQKCGIKLRDVIL